MRPCLSVCSLWMRINVHYENISRIRAPNHSTTLEIFSSRLNCNLIGFSIRYNSHIRSQPPKSWIEFKLQIPFGVEFRPINNQVWHGHGCSANQLRNLACIGHAKCQVLHAHVVHYCNLLAAGKPPTNMARRCWLCLTKCYWIWVPNPIFQPNWGDNLGFLTR